MTNFIKKALLLSFAVVSFSQASIAADMPPQLPEQPEEQPQLPEHPRRERPRRDRTPECYNGCGYNQVIQKTIIVNCPVSFNYLDLTQIFGMNRQYRDYSLVAVAVEVFGGANGTQFNLVVNNQVHGSFFNPFGVVTFAPQYPVTLGGYNSVLLQVNGVLNIRAVTVHLRAPYAY